MNTDSEIDRLQQEIEECLNVEALYAENPGLIEAVEKWIDDLSNCIVTGEKITQSMIDSMGDHSLDIKGTLRIKAFPAEFINRKTKEIGMLISAIAEMNGLRMPETFSKSRPVDDVQIIAARATLERHGRRNYRHMLLSYLNEIEKKKK